MVVSTPRVPHTIFEAIAQGKRLVITCRACKSITYSDPADLPLRPNIELSTMEAFWPCPNCDAVNGELGVANGVVIISAE